MEAAEVEQRSFGDRFWGYDLEIVTRSMEMSSMLREEERCRANDAQLIAIEIQSTWQQEIKEEEYSDSFVKALEQVQERRRYLKSVFSTDTSQQIIDYQWSTRIKIRPSSLDGIGELNSSKKSKRIKSMPHSTDSAMMRSATAPMDSLVELQAVHKSSSSPGSRRASEGPSPSPSTVRSPSNRGPHGTGAHNSGSLALLMKHLNLTGQDPGTISKHIDSLDGHPEYKWDQEMLLKLSFQELCQTAIEGTPVSSPHILVLDSIDLLGELISRSFNVRKMLRYTVFGSWIKRKEWWKFAEALAERTRLTTITMADRYLTPEFNFSVNVADWLLMAREQAGKEGYVERRLIRTDDEHKTAVADSVKRNKYCDRRERLCKLSRTIAVGTMVWALHGLGAIWLPAIVEAVHVRSPSANDEEWDTFTYDLIYILTQQSFSVAIEVQNSAYQVLKFSAMALLADHNQQLERDTERGESSQINMSKNPNEENEVQYSQRLLNITKSRCDTSVHPERALAEYAYDTFYSTENEHMTDFNDDGGSNNLQEGQNSVDVLFDAILESQMCPSSSSLACVSSPVPLLDCKETCSFKSFLMSLPQRNQNALTFMGIDDKLTREEW
eukprot:CAMPEP_0119036496 /NCGR_PEP_ID=MMETSP1177-20130426/4227_1 /TAXON_ID=2985 /ORGANISM="Ochromonas sp, Strain CCMP1899" /LENGTH=610 /DNA_ID=CAMNT_0006996443 /DNA_START=238 /DNA_END=2067 /DNA_ORIENTATION=-